MKRYLFAVMMLAACDNSEPPSDGLGDSGMMMPMGDASQDSAVSLSDAGDGSVVGDGATLPMCPSPARYCADQNTLSVCDATTGETTELNCGSTAPKCCTWGTEPGSPFAQCLTVQECTNRGGH